LRPSDSYSLSLHDALPILTKLASALLLGSSLIGCAAVVKTPYEQPAINMPGSFQNNKILSQQIHADILADQWWTLFKDPQLNNRSEEHTSELQSRENLVCR